MIREATDIEIVQVMANLRQEDYEELFYSSSFDNEQDFLMDMTQVVHYMGCDVCLIGNEPVMLGGINPVRHGVFNIWGFGTDRAEEAMVQITKRAQEYITEAFDMGAHRIQAASRCGHKQAHRWLSLVGLIRESKMVGFGSDGSDYYMYAVTR